MKFDASTSYIKCLKRKIAIMFCGTYYKNWETQYYLILQSGCT